MDTHDQHTEHHDEVNDSIVTRFLGICIGIGLVAMFISFHYSMGWAWHVVSIASGLVGAVMGAAGTSVYGRNNAAILAYAGVTAFICGFLLFFGIVQMFLK